MPERIAKIRCPIASLEKPAFSIFFASTNSFCADFLSFPWTLYPSALTDWGVKPRCPITGIPALIILEIADKSNKEVVTYSKQNYSKYDQIIITKKYGEPHEFFLFYWPWNPATYQNDPSLSTNFHADWYWVDSFDKFQFKNDWEIKELAINPHTLLITSPQNFPDKGAKKLDTIDFLDGSPAFDIISYD